MEALAQQFLVQGVFAFILVFVRIGTAMMILPGIGDTFTPVQVRLFIALSFSLVVMPFIAPGVPSAVQSAPAMFLLIGQEFLIGIFIGTLARILVSALDTAGMIISMISGLGSAQIFNPASSVQGSLIGTLLTMVGVMMIFATDLHHMLLLGLLGSYELFPVGTMPPAEDLSQGIVRMIGVSFLVALQLSAPFVIVGLIVYITMGILSRLMPQIQVFMLAVPAQILLSFFMLALVLSAMMLFWLSTFEENMMFFLNGG